MYASKCILSVLLLACVVGANADVLESWGEGTAGVDFDWIPELNRLTILHGNGLNYKFWVHDGSEEPGTGVIDNITVDANAVGDFTLLIEEEQGGPGALHWNEGDLRYAGGTSTVTGIKVGGTLAEPGKSVAIDRLDGSIDVAGPVDTLTIDTWVTDPLARMDIDGNVRQLSIAGRCFGAVFIGGDLLELLEIGADLLGVIDVGGDVLGSLLISMGLSEPTTTISVRGSVGPGALIATGEYVFGQVAVTGDCDGTIRLGTVDDTGYVVVKGSVAGRIAFQPGTWLFGKLDIERDLLGDIVFLGFYGTGIDGGRIHIRGSMRNNAPGHEISAGALIDGAIAVDYDGWDPGDDWEDGATVNIAGITYYGNAPKIWEIQRWRGDMNNDGALNDADADPFLLALTQPAEYELQYPGLEGSRVYHGDCNCDGVFDREDIPLFTFLYKNNCYTTDCINIECPDYLLTPPEAAAAWEDALDPALRPVLLGVIRAAVDEWGEDEPGPFWQEVLTYLED